MKIKPLSHIIVLMGKPHTSLKETINRKNNC